MHYNNNAMFGTDLKIIETDGFLQNSVRKIVPLLEVAKTKRRDISRKYP